MKFGQKDKIEQLSIHNPYCRDMNGIYCIVEIKDDPWCLYYLLERTIEKHLPCGWDSWLFMQTAPKSTIEKRKFYHVDYTCDDFHIFRKEGYSYRGKLGKNYPNMRFKALALRCGFENPERFTGRAARCTGIANSKCKYWLIVMLYMYLYFIFLLLIFVFTSWRRCSKYDVSQSKTQVYQCEQRLQ